MRLGWAVLALGAVALLAGCSGQNKREALAECRMNAARVYPRWREDEFLTPAADFAYFCMQAKGFDLLPRGAKECPYSDGVFIETAEDCYHRPQFWE